MTVSAIKLLAVITAAVVLTACSKVGSEAWCDDMRDKPKGEWTGDESGQYTQYCILKMDPDKV